MAAVSIWQWAVTEDLGPLFERLVAADADAFAQIAAEGVTGRRLADLAAAAEAKMRAMGLPEEELATMRKGLEAMLAEEADWAEAAAQEGVPEVGLATSHMFSDGPYAAMSEDDRATQVATLFERYKAAATEAMGVPGQGLAAAFGVSLEQLFRAEDAEALMDTCLDARSWVWVGEEAVYALNQLQQDNDLPIDVTFARMPVEVFNAIMAAVRSA